jgi:hypothetical protein
VSLYCRAAELCDKIVEGFLRTTEKQHDEALAGSHAGKLAYNSRRGTRYDGSRLHWNMCALGLDVAFTEAGSQPAALWGACQQSNGRRSGWLFRQEFDEPHASDDAEHDFAGFYSNILAG